METFEKLACNNTSKIGTLPSESKDVSIKFSEQFLHIFNNTDRLNGIQGRKKVQKRESIFKYQS